MPSKKNIILILLIGFFTLLYSSGFSQSKNADKKIAITNQLKKLNSKLNDPTLEKEVITAFNKSYANYPDENFTGAKAKKIIFTDSVWTKDDLLQTDIIPGIILFHHEKTNKCYAYYVNIGKIDNEIAFAYSPGTPNYALADGSVLEFFKQTEINCSIVK